MGTRTADIWKAVSDAILGKPELRGSEVASLAGVPAEEGRRFWQAMGFPSVHHNETQFTRRDAEVLSIAAVLIDADDGPDRDILLQMARATGQSLSRVATMQIGRAHV